MLKAFTTMAKVLTCVLILPKQQKNIRRTRPGSLCNWLRYNIVYNTRYKSIYIYVYEIMHNIIEGYWYELKIHSVVYLLQEKSI